MNSLDDYRTRLIAIDPQITRYLPSAIDQLIADLDAPEAVETTPVVTITPVAEATELYRHEQGQPSPQEVKMHLDIESGSLSSAYTPYGDEHSIHESVYHHRGVLWTIPCLTMDAANRMLSEVAPLCQRIIDGTTIEWDGQSHVGTHSADATAAIEGIAQIVETYDDVDNVLQEYSGDEYYDDGPAAAREALGITADTSDDELTRIGEQAAAEALDNSAVIADLAEYLTQLREELRDANRDELADVAAEIARLTIRRGELIRRQLSWGDTSRAVAERAGMSHVGVQKIGKRQS